MSESAEIDRKIAEYPDWRGRLLADIRRLVRDAAPDIVEECKWRGAPTWSHNGLVCVANVFKSTVKVIFSSGAKLADPSHLFNSELSGKSWRGITLGENDTLSAAAFKKMVRAAIELNNGKKPGPRRAASPGKARRKRPS